MGRALCASRAAGRALCADRAAGRAHDHAHSAGFVWVGRGTVDAVTRVAAIDCGTNSIRLLVADIEGAALQDVERRMEIVRLGAGVDRTGVLDPEALQRTFAVIADYRARIRELGAEKVRFVATSATRDAANREVFVEGVREILGVEPEVISGQEEAELSFAGATSVAASPDPVLVVDIGGGSTELVLGAGGRVISQISLDVGSVRMRERHLKHDPPTAAEEAAARADVSSHLDRAAAVVDLGRTASLVGVAGTITSVTAEVLGLDRYRPEVVDGAVMRISEVEDACRWLLDATHAERSARGHMHPGRVDVIAAGALIWSEVLRRVVAEVEAAGGSLETTTTSEHDILDGLALSLA